MDTAWIQVFVLTMSECIAPSGKTVCQQQEFQLEFATAQACELAREQLVSLKSQMDNVIVDRNRTRCAASVREQQVFASVDDAMLTIEPGTAATAAAPRAPETAADGGSQTAHRERLDSLPTCEDARGQRPCKIGEIILEPTSEQSAEVWRRSN